MVTMQSAHALVIGIAHYRHVNPLTPAVLDDARDIRDLLVDAGTCGYPPENVQLLLDDQATQAGFRQALGALAKRSTPESTVLLYISSHGGRIESGSCAGEYLLPVDTEFTSPEALAQTAISGDEFTRALRAIPAAKAIVIFDACHSGGIGQPKDARMPELKALPEEYYGALASGYGRVILASSRSTEYSWVLPGARNSLFTKHLLAGLGGGVSGSAGVVRIFDLFDYVQPRVTAEHRDQHPIFKAEIEENLPVALYRGGQAPGPAPLHKREDAFQWDVFISYRHQDPAKTWVRQKLQAQLEREGLRVCIDYRDFRLGSPLITEMENAIAHSRYTLCVLTPAYVEGAFTELENILAEHLGLESRQRRMLAIMREPCKPRLGVRARLWLDMTQDDGFQDNVARLAREIRQPL